MAAAPLQQLAKQLNLTDPEPEGYILNTDEEKQIIAHAIEQAKKHKAYKLTEKGFSQDEIMKKLSQIDWQKEIDKKSLLAQANSRKQQDLWHHEQREKEKTLAAERQRELRVRCDAKYMYRLMKWTSDRVFGKPLRLHNDNKHFITALCYFMAEDERFETELGYSLKKGLLIRGISGLGKTHLVRCLENNELNPVLVLSMIEIADEIKEKGEYRIELGNRKVIYLDDVGTEEPTVNHYGTKINFFKNFIELVYLKNKTFSKLMISTNNSFAEIEEKYGFRVRSRVKDMFNIIDVRGEDMRG